MFEPNNYRDAQNLLRDKTSMFMTHNEFLYLTSSRWDEKYQFFTIDMTKDI